MANVRMVERRERLRLTLEPREPFGIAGEDVRENLDRDVAIESSVAGSVDLAHPARAQRRDDLVRA